MDTAAERAEVQNELNIKYTRRPEGCERRSSWIHAYTQGTVVRAYTGLTLKTVMSFSRIDRAHEGGPCAIYYYRDGAVIRARGLPRRSEGHNRGFSIFREHRTISSRTKPHIFSRGQNERTNRNRLIFVTNKKKTMFCNRTEFIEWNIIYVGIVIEK